jgi:DNA-binding transcriptional ArsR family regulator
VDSLRLYLLGRQLVKIADASFDRSGAAAPPLGLTLVLEDIVTHPESSISEITARTGFPQSHVSTSVARFRERGIVETSADPSDGRRTLVRAKRSYVRSAGRRGSASADDAIRAALGDAADVAVDVIGMLESLADRLMPDAHGEMPRIGTQRPQTTKTRREK